MTSFERLDKLPDSLPPHGDVFLQVGCSQCPNSLCIHIKQPEGDIDDFLRNLDPPYLRIWDSARASRARARNCDPSVECLGRELIASTVEKINTEFEGNI